MEQALIDLINQIKNLAPEVWAIYMTQVQVGIMQYKVGLVASIVAILLGIALLIYGIKEGRESYDGTGKQITSAILLTCGAIASILLITEIVGMNANPAYYAIQLLKQSLP